MLMDKLSSKERMDKFYKGEVIDRVPFISSATMYAGRMVGLSCEEFYFDVKKSYNAQKLVCEMHQCDGGPCYDLPHGEVLDFGGELAFPKTTKVELPLVKRYPVNNLNEAIDYKIPQSSRWISLHKKIEFLKYMHEQELWGGVSISAGSPFTMVGSIVNTNLLFRWLIKEPEIVHKLLKQAVEYLLQSADILIQEFGIERCSVSSNYPFESNELISSKTFETFSMPYILEVHKRLREKGLKNFGIHLCGNQNKNLHYYKELNLPDRSFISSDERNDLVNVAKILGNQYIYAGNIPSGLLVEGKPIEVYRCSESVIKSMKYNDGGFVLMPSCDLPINTSPINLYAMLKACRDFGQY